MRYKEYKEYRNIKFDYVKKIPSHWTICSWRYITKILTDYTANGSFKDLADNVKYLDYKSYARVIRLTDLRKDMKNEGIYVDEDAYNFLGKSSLDGGEFLIANVGAYAGLILQMPSINYKATLGPNMMMAKFNERVLNRFMVHLGQSEYIKQQFSLKANSSSAQPKLNKEDFRSIKFLLPPIEEQEKIVEFLDKKTSEINELIEEKEKLIELLKEKREAIITEAVTKGLDKNVNMKDSGVEWIGEIPEQWEKFRLKNICTINPNKSELNIEKDIFVSFVPMENIKDGEIDLSLIKKVNEVYSGYSYFRDGDIIMAKVTPCFENGNIAIAENMNNAVGFGTTELHVLRTNSKVDNRYLYYLIKENGFKTKAISSMYGVGGLKRTPTEFISNFVVYIPKIKEQLEIVEYIDEKIKCIEDIVLETKQTILKMQNYKKSLISEVVTGKIDVRNEV